MTKAPSFLGETSAVMYTGILYTRTRNYSSTYGIYQVYYSIISSIAPAVRIALFAVFVLYAPPSLAFPFTSAPNFAGGRLVGPTDYWCVPTPIIIIAVQHLM